MNLFVLVLLVFLAWIAIAGILLLFFYAVGETRPRGDPPERA